MIAVARLRLPQSVTDSVVTDSDVTDSVVSDRIKSSLIAVARLRLAGNCVTDSGI
jgi:hypothetical protein